jgi:hypothetical protein
MTRLTNCRLSLFAAALVVVLLAGTSVPQGHTPIASRFTYNEHLFPIFRDRCGSCHIEGGVAPMSLVTYKSAYPWTQSIREEVMGLRMPPWQAEDGFGDFKNGHVLPAHEMDMILEWSAGGYPQGPRDQAPEPPVIADGWSLGEPAVTLRVPNAFELDGGTSETVRYFVLPTDLEADSVLVGVDFIPGARAVVRGAAVFVDDTGTARALDDASDDNRPGFGQASDMGYPTTAPIAVFTPGQQRVINDAVGYPLPAGADIVLRVHYKKTWITEGSAFSDQSQVGLHLGQDDAAELESALVASPTAVSGRQLAFTFELERESTVFSLFPEVDIESSELVVEAVQPDGTRVPMLWLREPDNGWPTRFWFDEPVTLPAGSHLEVTTLLEPAAQRQPRVSLVGNATAPVRIAVDYLSGGSAAN